MTDYVRTEKILRALASKSRLQILESIQKGVNNPGDISKELMRHRSTIEKHLRVLLGAGIVTKVPSLSSAGQLMIRYNISETMKELLTEIQRLLR